MPIDGCGQEKNTQIPSFPVFFFFSFSLSLLIFLHHLFVVVRAASGPSAGTDWQLYGMKGLLLLQKDIIGGKVGHGAGELERELETSRRQKSWSQRLGFQKQSGGVFSLLSSFFPFALLLSAASIPSFKLLVAC